MNVEVQDELLDLHQASAYLKVSPKTLYCWVHQRRIPFRKHGRRLAFHRDELAAWSAQNAVPAVVRSH